LVVASPARRRPLESKTIVETILFAREGRETHDKNMIT